MSNTNIIDFCPQRALNGRTHSKKRFSRGRFTSTSPLGQRKRSTNPEKGWFYGQIDPD
jgi:hypothetical protein